MFYITTPPFGHPFLTTPPFGHPSKGGEFHPASERGVGDGKNDVRWCYRYGSPNGLGRNGVLLRFYSANLFVRYLLRLNFF
jgi:hypothetical protein